MPIKSFPPHELADEDGLLAVGGDLSVDSLLLAYRNGIFPWPLDEEVLTWFSPEPRALLFLSEFHVSKSLSKELKRAPFRFSTNQAFDRVIEQCAAVKNRFDSRGRPQPGTWITTDMVHAYQQLYRAGFAHSIECWEESELVGGLYGVGIGSYFAGESMFYLRPNASKLAMCHLVEHLSSRGVEWIDCQVMTPLFQSFGAREVSRSKFLALLSTAISRDAILF